MTRHRWLEAKWVVKINDFADRLRDHRFTDEKGNGFVLERVRDNYIEAKYVERLDYTETVIDPFGKEISFNRVDFNQCRLRITNTYPGLELIDSTRKTQQLMNQLMILNDYSISINPLTVDVLEWASTIHQSTKTEWVIDLIQIGDLELERGISAKAIIKGDHDVRDMIHQLVKGKNYNIEKIQLRFKDVYHGTLLLSDSGSAKVDVSQSDDLLDAVRKSTPHLQFRKAT